MLPNLFISVDRVSTGNTVPVSIRKFTGNFSLSIMEKVPEFRSVFQIFPECVLENSGTRPGNRKIFGMRSVNRKIVMLENILRPQFTAARLRWTNLFLLSPPVLFLLTPPVLFLLTPPVPVNCHGK